MYSVTFVDNHHKNENSKKEKRFSLLITLANFLHKNLYLRNPHLSIFGSPNGLLPLVLLEARFSPQIIPLCSWGKLVHRRRSQRLRRKDAPSRVALQVTVETSVELQPCRSSPRTRWEKKKVRVTHFPLGGRQEKKKSIFNSKASMRNDWDKTFFFQLRGVFCRYTEFA